MKSSNRLVIAAAIFFGLITVAALNFYLSSINKEVSDKLPETGVVVAKHTIPAHTRITADMLEIVSLPVESVHPDAVNSTAGVIGGINRSELYKGEQILAARIFTEDRRATLSYRIPEKMRAIAIPVNEVTGVAGYISVGDKVDVLVTYQKNEEISAKTVTYTVFQNVPVLAVGDNPREKDDQERQVVGTVTLSVTPAQAEVLAFAYLSGSFHLTLRSLTDENMVNLGYYSPDNFNSFRER